VTTAGEHTFSLDYVEDTAASEDEQSHFRPVEELIQFDGKKCYQEDISLKTADLATTLSYRDAASAGDGFETRRRPIPSSDESKSTARNSHRLFLTTFQVRKLTPSSLTGQSVIVRMTTVVSTKFRSHSRKTMMVKLDLCSMSR